MNMNMKNEKTMLALVLVAALAMVSVAGVALASESDAASETYSNNGTITIASDMEGNYYVYSQLKDVDGVLIDSVVDANVTITVNSDAKFTGYVYYCTAKTVADASTGKTSVVYDKILNTVYFDGVSDIAIETVGTYTYSNSDTCTVTVTGSTTGTVTLEQGMVQAGNGEIEYFTGTVITKTASFSMTNIAGASFEVVKKGSTTTTYVSGTLNDGDETNGVENAIIGNFEEISDFIDDATTSEDVVKFVENYEVSKITTMGKFTFNNSIVERDNVSGKVISGKTTLAGLIFEVAADSTATVFYDNKTEGALGSSELQNDGIFVVGGKLIVDTTADTEYDPDAIDNNGILIVNGIIEYTAKETQTVIDEVSNFKLWSAYYSVTNKTAETTTHYYTDLTSAMEASDNVTLYGFKLITEDMSVDDSLTLGEDALVIVGIPDLGIDIGSLVNDLIPSKYVEIITDVLTMLGYDLSDLSESNPTVTVTAGGAFDATDGSIYVINGKLSVDQDAEVLDSEVMATVCGMTEGTNTIYTNLDTALSLAKSGDNIELSMIGYIFSDATIAEGVTVTGMNNDLYSDPVIIYCGATLNIEGTLNVHGLYILPEVKANVSYTYDDVEYSASISLDAATVNINKGASLTTDYILLGGVLNIANDFDNTTSGSDVFNVNEIGIFSFILTSEDIEGMQTIGITFDVNIDSAVMNINGKLKSGAAISGNGHYNDTYSASLTVNVIGTLMTPDGFFDDSTSEVLTVINVTGKYLPGNANVPDKVSFINVTGSGNVTGYVSVLDTLTSGVLSDSFNVNTNNTVVKVTGDIKLAIVYGTTADKAISISNNDLVSTVYYLITPDNSEVVYVTLYTTTTGDNAEKLQYYKPAITGYNFISWMYEDGTVLTKSDITSSAIGSYEAIYAGFIIKTTQVSFEYLQNGTWVIDGVDVGASGFIDLDVGTHTIKFVAANGYELGDDYVIYINGKAITGASFTVGDDKITATYGGEVKEITKNSGLDLVTILLIIITIVIIIMAIIIALKLMRS